MTAAKAFEPDHVQYKIDNPWLFYEHFSVRHIGSLKRDCDADHPLFYCKETWETKRKENHVDSLRHKHILTGFSIWYGGPDGTDPHHGCDGLLIQVEGTCYKRRSTLEQELGVRFAFQGRLYTEEDLSDETRWKHAKEQRDRLLDPESHVTYCPICSDPRFLTDEELEAQRVEEWFKSEGELRKILKSLFKRDFPNVRPSWLVSPDTGARLELDCYCEDLSLAFEYQGAQHYKPIEFFGGEDRFLKQKERDDYKRSICKQHGITLIEVDGRVYNHNSPKTMKEHVKSELIARNINFAK